jgi:hypothetical protein
MAASSLATRAAWLVAPEDPVEAVCRGVVVARVEEGDVDAAGADAVGVRDAPGVPVEAPVPAEAAEAIACTIVATCWSVTRSDCAMDDSACSHAATCAGVGPAAVLLGEGDGIPLGVGSGVGEPDGEGLADGPEGVVVTGVQSASACASSCWMRPRA